MSQTTYAVTDFTDFAPAYDTRPAYADHVIEASLRITSAPGGRACDIGAGTALLTVPLLRYGLRVDAVEPTPAMRAIGERHTSRFANVSWADGQGERTGKPGGQYDLVTFGSSFDRTDQPAALTESARRLVPRGYFLCCWNHRDLDDPLQREIQELIAERVPGFRYGLRRVDPTDVIEASGLFDPVVHLAGSVVHEIDSTVWSDTWRSHATVGHQAGDGFEALVGEIGALVRARAGDTVRVPYTTRIWLARRREAGGEDAR
jgi:prepilin-type processing-associated H-X9-DG protein